MNEESLLSFASSCGVALIYTTNIITNTPIFDKNATIDEIAKKMSSEQTLERIEALEQKISKISSKPTVTRISVVLACVLSILSIVSVGWVVFDRVNTLINDDVTFTGFICMRNWGPQVVLHDGVIFRDSTVYGWSDEHNRTMWYIIDMSNRNEALQANIHNVSIYLLDFEEVSDFSLASAMRQYHSGLIYEHVFHGTIGTQLGSSPLVLVRQDSGTQLRDDLVAIPYISVGGGLTSSTRLRLVIDFEAPVSSWYTFKFYVEYDFDGRRAIYESTTYRRFFVASGTRPPRNLQAILESPTTSRL